MSPADYSRHGWLDPSRIASRLLTSKEDVARSAGLERDVLQLRDRAMRTETQRRLREMMEIIDKMVPRMGSAVMAFAWYRSQPISGFSGRTAMQLVSEGRAMDVLNYIDAVDAGVQA